MSEILVSAGSRNNLAPSPLVALLTFLYAAIFAYVFRDFAYAEPGGFPEFYTTGKLACFDLRGLYNQHLQDVFHPGNQGTGYFIHLPYEAFLLVPLSYLPQTFAYAVWTLINLACLLAAAFILRRHFSKFELLLPFAFAPMLSLLLNGQDIGILTLLVAMAFDRFALRKDFQAGAVMALGLFKFPLVVPLMAILTFRHRKVLFGFLSASIPLLAVSAVAIGRQGIREYLAITHVSDAKEDPAILVNVRGVIGEFFGYQTALVIALSVAIFLLAAWIKSDRISTFCIAVMATQLVSWHSHLYDALLLLIPMAWMSEKDSKWIRQIPTVLLLGTAALLMSHSRIYLLGMFLCVLFPLFVLNLIRNQFVLCRVPPDQVL